MAKITTGKAFKSEDFSDEGRYLVITNKDILKVNTNCISGDRIDIDDSKIIDKYSLANPSVLITMDGVNIGKTGRYQNKFAVLAQRVGRLESDELNFVYQITQNDRFINTMKTLSVGNAIKHISLKQISEYVLSVPLEDSEKRRIGNLLTGLDQTITSNQRKGKSSNKDGISTYKLNLMETTRSINYRVNQNPQLTNNYSKINVLNILVSP
ncbi:restriction endonuclease subunit S [Levilactobacillus namurensis]|uniref:restriction endonuclease subunit S n=1 Tax=Levilactobacillus namurensis TaxID=380393 RepID=UPI003F65775E